MKRASRFFTYAQPQDRKHDLFSVVRKHFEDDRIRTLFTFYMHVITTESVPGAGIVFPLIFANVMEFTLPVGGSASFTDALARVIEVCGGSVITGADVKEIVVRSGHATAIRLANGGAVEGSRFIASAIDAPTTMRMAGEDLFPESVRRKLNGWHWGSHSLVTLHLALRHKPIYRSAEFDSDINRAFNIFFGMDDIKQVRSCFDDCAANKFPHVLMGNGACNSAVDSTYAPTNGHSAFWWPFAPMRLMETPVTGTAKERTTRSACLVCGGNTHPISTTAMPARDSCLRHSISNVSMSTWCMVQCAWAPISRLSLASIGPIPCYRERARRSRASISAGRRPATAGALTERPATSPQMRLPTTFS